MEHLLNRAMLQTFREKLEEEEKAEATIEKYMHDVGMFIKFAEGEGEYVNKGTMIAYKEHLADRYAASSVNSITIANLPYGVTYTVTETAVDGYNTTKTGDTGTIGAAEQTASFTNNKGVEVDTGITLDSMPYILALCLVALCAVALVVRKRFSVNR